MLQRLSCETEQTLRNLLVTMMVTFPNKILLFSHFRALWDEGTVYPELSINFESAKCCQLVRHGYWERWHTNSSIEQNMIQLFKIRWKTNWIREIRIPHSVWWCLLTYLQSQLNLLYLSHVAEVLIWSPFPPPSIWECVLLIRCLDVLCLNKWHNKRKKVWLDTA